MFCIQLRENRSPLTCQPGIQKTGRPSRWEKEAQVKAGEQGLAAQREAHREKLREEERELWKRIANSRNRRHFGTFEGGRVYQALQIESKSVLDAPYRVKKCLRRSM